MLPLYPGVPCGVSHGAVRMLWITNKISYWVCTTGWTQTHCIPNLGHLLWSLQSMGRLASIMRKSRTFLITNANSLHWQQAQQKMSQIRNASLCVHLLVQTHRDLVFVPDSWKNVPKSETNFLKSMRIITEQWRHSLWQNFAHKIVHSSCYVLLKFDGSFMKVVEKLFLKMMPIAKVWFVTLFVGLHITLLLSLEVLHTKLITRVFNTDFFFCTYQTCCLWTIKQFLTLPISCTSMVLLLIIT